MHFSRRIAGGRRGHPSLAGTPIDLHANQSDGRKTVEIGLRLSNGLVGRHLAFDYIEKANEILMPVALHTAADGPGGAPGQHASYL